MNANTKIALSVPGSRKQERYFSFRLKQGLNNEPPEYSNAGKIFVVSDIEGNFQSFCKLLIKAKVINKYLDWTYEDNHLVIAGDCFDRGEQVMECLWLIYSLEEKARKKGGYVHFILGNHEIMNMNGDWRYVHPKYAERTKSQRPLAALYDGNNELWRWLCTKNIIEKIGRVLFVHAGIAPELLQLGLSIREINNLARPFYARATGPFGDSSLAIIYDPKYSPFWYRGYYEGSATEELVDATLTHFRVKSIVTGHTVIGQVTSFFNGKVINVDTDHAADISEGLLIRDHRFYRIRLDGEKERIR